MGKQFNDMLNKIRKQHNITVHNFQNYEKDSQVDYETQHLFDVSIKVFSCELASKSYQFNQFKTWISRILPTITNDFLIWGILYYFFIQQYYFRNIEDFLTLVKKYEPYEKFTTGEYLKQNINTIAKIVRENRYANSQLYQKFYQNNRDVWSLRDVLNRLKSEGL